MSDRSILLSRKLMSVFSILSLSNKLNFIEANGIKIYAGRHQPLFTISPSGMKLTSLTIPESLYQNTSPLPDDFVPDNQLESIIRNIETKNAILRLNHIGICYLVKSKVLEKERLKSEVKKSNWHLYEEDSLDSSSWLFVGNRENPQDPLFEFVLSENIKDQWRDYWLPHFQIDIDTSLEVGEIKELIVREFENKVIPYHLVVVKNHIYVIRARLGIISGINIDLDFGIKGRPTQLHREKLLKLIV